MTELRYVVLGRPTSWKRTNRVNGRNITPAGMRSAKRAHAWAAITAMRRTDAANPRVEVVVRRIEETVKPKRARRAKGVV